MGTSAFRVRLAVALGLPLAVGCKSAPSPPPQPPTGGTAVAGGSGSASTVPTLPPDTAGLCPAEHVHERVCGTVFDDGSYAKVSAPAPLDACPTTVAALRDFEENGIIDGWRMDPKDPGFENFRWDLARSQAYEVNSGAGYQGDPRCCYERCTPLPVAAAPRTALPAGMHAYEECWPAPDRTDHPAAGAPNCPAVLHTRLWYPYGVQDPLDDAPFARASEGGHCCYSVASLHRCPPNTFEGDGGTCNAPNPGGRPLRDAGAVVTAPGRPTRSWLTPGDAASAIPGGLTPEARAHAAVAWAREAAYEHASVAAFARLSLDLLAHAAPPELVDAAHVAARDEIRHAQLCYGLASEFGQRAVGPGPLALAEHTRALTLEDLAVEWFRDGCVNETVAALAVTEAARLAGTPALRATLDAIGADEATHAELSYRILDWALGIGGSALHARIASELALVKGELAASGAPPAQAHDDIARDERTGLLRPGTAAALRRRVLADVVVPCTDALLARHA